MPATGLPADNISVDTHTRSAFTSPTNVAAYLWATMAAKELRFISADEATERMGQTLATLATLERHEDARMFYNWYDPVTGEKLDLARGRLDRVPVPLQRRQRVAGRRPADGDPGRQPAPRRSGLYGSMDFGLLRPARGLIRGGFWDELPPGCSVLDSYRDRGPVTTTCHHYGAFNTGPRMLGYIGIAEGRDPGHLLQRLADVPPTYDWSWQEMQPQGVTRTYLGVDVFEATTRPRHRPRADLGRVDVRGADGAAARPGGGVGAGELGRQPSAVRPGPDRTRARGGRLRLLGLLSGQQPGQRLLREYGVDPIGLEPNGYASDQERTYVDYGFDACRPAQRLPTDYGRGVVARTSFLAMDFNMDAALENLANLGRTLRRVRLGRVLRLGRRHDRPLLLPRPRPGHGDRGPGQRAAQRQAQKYFSRGYIQEALRPLMAMEEFTWVGRHERVRPDRLGAADRTALRPGRLDQVAGGLSLQRRSPPPAAAVTSLVVAGGRGAIGYVVHLLNGDEHRRPRPWQRRLDRQPCRTARSPTPAAHPAYRYAVAAMSSPDHPLGPCPTRSRRHRARARPEKVRIDVAVQRPLGDLRRPSWIVGSERLS